MVDTISIFFVAMSIVVLVYLVMKLKGKNRMPLMIELFYLVSYAFVMIIFLYPEILVFMERAFGLASAINFFIYLSIFVGYLMIFVLYQKTERQREQITLLSRELALGKDNNSRPKRKAAIPARRARR